MREKDETRLFAEPVTELVAKNYYDIIHNPMDLHTMQMKSSKGVYKSLQALRQDFEQMCLNAIIFNKAGDEYSLTVITCNNDIDNLVNISNRYKCDNLGIAKLDDTRDFTEVLSSKNVIYGIENFVEFINDEIDIYILAISGLTSANLILKIAETGKTLAIANKENIISLGKILMNKCKKFRIETIT